MSLLDAFENNMKDRKCTTRSDSIALGRAAFQQLIARLKRVVGKINADYDVAGLCHQLPARIGELVRRGGGKLAK